MINNTIELIAWHGVYMNTCLLLSEAAPLWRGSIGTAPLWRRPPLEPPQSRLKRPGSRLKTLSLLSNFSFPIPTQPFCTWCNLLLTMVAPFPRSQHSAPSPSNSCLLLLHFHPLFIYVHESYGMGNYNKISGSLKNSIFHGIFDTSKSMFKNIFSNLY